MFNTFRILCQSKINFQMENILIDSQGHLQVTDFGLAKWLKKGHRTRTICGTIQYIGETIRLFAY